MSARPWTEAHRREARIATRRLADEEEIAGHADVAQALTLRVGLDRTEAVWRESLRGVLWAAKDASRIDAAVRRARGLAEGRRGGEKTNGREYLTLYGARQYRANFAPKARIFRVTRIRRAAR